MDTADVFDDITSSEALFEAWNTFQRGKRHRRDVRDFWRSVEQNIFRLRRELISGDYRHGSYESFFVHDPKRRHIRKARVRDRVVHQALHNVLARVWEPTLLHDVYSARVGKGTHAGVKRLVEMARKVSKNYTGACWGLKCDVRRFYDTVDHAILMRLIERRVKNERALRIIREVVSSFHTEGASRKGALSGKGLPIGNVTSQVFTNIYLDELDRFIKHQLRVKHYARFCDDFVLLSAHRSDLLGWREAIGDFLSSKLRLSLHPSKVIIRPLRQGIDFVGYVVLPHHCVLRNSTKRRMFRRLSRRVDAAIESEGGRCDVAQSLSSYLGMLSHADAYEMGNLVRNRFCVF